jgi:hypothetical protein
MQRVDRTVFISYRRANVPWALAVFQSLTRNGYDVFFDYNGLAAGDFEKVILENIRARAHFILLLTPSSLERFENPNDWLRREVDAALASQRNIVPLLLEGFDFNKAAGGTQNRTLVALRRYHGLRVHADFFEEAMKRLCEKYLDLPLETVLHPTSYFAQQKAEEQKAAAGIAPVVTQAHTFIRLRQLG